MYIYIILYISIYLYIYIYIYISIYIYIYICEQPRGKDTPGYQDLIFYDQYLRRYEQFNEK